MSSNISSTTLESWRERPPSSYSIKVNIFSQLQNSTLCSDGHYKSRRFSSGGYRWRLIIYPKGNDKDNGSGYISMYIEIDSTSLIATTPNEVYADIRFFIFNKKENKYFTIQDVEAKQFNILRTIWGLPKVLPLDIFNEHKNGYIFDGDYCEFGVDIVVTPPPTKWEIISYDEKLTHPKFSWFVKNFSQMKENPLISNTFSKGGVKWVLKLYPKGNSTKDGKWLSYFLALADGENLKEDDKIYVEADLTIADPRGSNHLTYKLIWWFDYPFKGSGWHQFMSLDVLRKSYLDKDDTLNVEIDFKIVSTTKYSSFV